MLSLTAARSPSIVVGVLQREPQKEIGCVEMLLAFDPEWGLLTLVREVSPLQDNLDLMLKGGSFLSLSSQQPSGLEM